MLDGDGSGRNAERRQAADAQGSDGGRDGAGTVGGPARRDETPPWPHGVPAPDGSPETSDGAPETDTGSPETSDGAPETGDARWRVVAAALWRACLAAAGLGLIGWLVLRGPLVAPISLYASSSSTIGFYSASHILAAMAVLAAAAALVAAVRGRVVLPAWPLLVGLALPLTGLWLAERHAVYPHDARYDLLVDLAPAALYVALAGALGAAGRGRPGPRGRRNRRTRAAGVRSGGHAAVLPALAATCLAGCGLAAAALRQFARGRPTPVSWTGPAAAAIPVRAAATLHNPNVLAALLLLAAGACLALACGSRSRWLAAAGLLLAVPVVAALTLTFSRGAYLGLATAVLVSLGLAPPGRRLRVLVAAAAVGATFAAVSAHVPGVAARTHAIGVASAGDNASRFFTWIDALAVWHAHPVTGAGPGGLEALYAVMAPLGWHGSYIFTVVPSSADDDLIEWLAQGGAVGLVLLVAGAAAAAVGLGRALRHGGTDSRGVAAPLIGAALGVALQGCFEVTAYTLPVQAALAWTMALLTAGAGAAADLRLRPWARLGPLAAAAACVALAAGLWSAWAPFTRFEAAFATFAAGHPAQALGPLTAAVAADPSSERAQAAAGDAAVLALYGPAPADPAGLAEAARTHLAAALRLDPYDGSVWSVAGSLAVRLGQTEAAACAQQAAVHTRPYDPFLSFVLGRTLTAMGLPGRGRIDMGYAAWNFPPTLGVLAEHGATGGYSYRLGTRQLAEARTAWGSGALPQAPVEPLPATACASALTGAGLPPAAYRLAMTAVPARPAQLGPAAPLARWLAKGRGFRTAAAAPSPGTRPRSATTGKGHG